MSAADVIDRRGERRRAATAARPHLVAHPAPRRCSSIDRGGDTPIDRHVTGIDARRRLSGAARPVRRGRHGAGPARARQRPVRRRRRARLGGRHGQGGDEAGVRGQRAADLRLRRRADSASGSATSAARCSAIVDRLGVSGVRQAGEPRIERRHLEGQARRPSCAPRSTLAAEFDRKIVIEAAVPERARDRSARCSATTSPRRRCPARSSRRASSTTTRPSTSTTDSKPLIPAD